MLKLSQPAFGIAEQGTNRKGFPRGGLILESAFDVDGQHVTARRPTSNDVIVDAAGTAFDATDLSVTLQVPCNSSVAAITVKVSARDAGATGGALGEPPGVVNTTATTGTCGASRPLTATVSDPNGDAGPLRWRVDGVLLAPGTTSIMVNTPHSIEAVVRDARGATTTAREAVSCQ